tara:strand:- start:13 stop:660 length:648 start_codon:yes stop_codon:yes gene_type:complete
MSKVLDLGYGSGSATIAWKSHGHEVVGVDWATNATIQGDFTTPEVWERIRQSGPYDFVWFAPDCSIFSMAGSLPWDENYNPTSERARDEVSGIVWVLQQIHSMNPRYGWMMENPRAMMRKMAFVKRLHRVTVSYCQYGDSRMKPTDFFGHIPGSFRPRICVYGASCHDAAPRGSRSGTQSMTKEEAGKMPYRLSKEIMDAVLESKGETYPRLEDF